MTDKYTLSDCIGDNLVAGNRISLSGIWLSESASLADVALNVFVGLWPTTSRLSIVAPCGPGETWWLAVCCKGLAGCDFWLSE